MADKLKKKDIDRLENTSIATVFDSGEDGSCGVSQNCVGSVTNTCTDSSTVCVDHSSACTDGSTVCADKSTACVDESTACVDDSTAAACALAKTKAAFIQTT